MKILRLVLTAALENAYKDIFHFLQPSYRGNWDMLQIVFIFKFSGSFCSLNLIKGDDGYTLTGGLFK